MTRDDDEARHDRRMAVLAWGGLIFVPGGPRFVGWAINGWGRRSRLQENGESAGAGAITPSAMRMLTSSKGALDTRGSATRLPSIM